MAGIPDSKMFECELDGLITLLWGPSVIKEEVFRRWSQEFLFYAHEPTALIQCEGGPCAVLAPVQAFILKTVIAQGLQTDDWREAREQRSNELLVSAVCDILSQASADNTYKVVHMHEGNSTLLQSEGEEVQPHNVASDANRTLMDNKRFHSLLRVKSFKSIEDVRTFYTKNKEILRNKFGVLLLLYSVITTKGLAVISDEVNDASEPLIESIYGYGSQSLINLMLTGRAVGHVWDHDKDVGGLQLKGIDRQGEVGYLALLEHMRYCEVGSFLKNPRQPIWVLASETHLTVLFSLDTRLVSPETVDAVARRVFRSFDPDGNNFIAATHLQEVLRQLELVADPEYVNIMIKKLDAENLGIILLHAFLEEFFPNERPQIPDTFTIFHYNGLPNSHSDCVVRYQEGNAVLLECDVKCMLDSNPMLTCLQTKWPNIEVTWTSGLTPSLN